MLKGTRITLRAITRDDLPRYVTWLTDVEVTEHLCTYLPMNLDDEIGWYESQRTNPHVLNFAVETETGRHIGSVGLLNIDQRVQMAELGIVIGEKSAWSKGYGGEAIAVLLKYAFNMLNLNRVYLRVDTTHPAAIQCYTHAGFVKEGELRQTAFYNGQFINHYIMSVLRSEYPANK